MQAPRTTPPRPPHHDFRPATFDVVTAEMQRLEAVGLRADLEASQYISRLLVEIISNPELAID